MTQALGESKMDFGALKRLKILCISETGWHDTETLLADTKDAGGKAVNQCDIPRLAMGDLHSQNAAGSSAHWSRHKPWMGRLIGFCSTSARDRNGCTSGSPKKVPTSGSSGTSVSPQTL